VRVVLVDFGERHRHTDKRAALGNERQVLNGYSNKTNKDKASEKSLRILQSHEITSGEAYCRKLTNLSFSPLGKPADRAMYFTFRNFFFFFLL